MFLQIALAQEQKLTLRVDKGTLLLLQATWNQQIYRHFDYRSSVSATTSLPRRGLRMVFLADSRKTDISRATWLWLVGHLPEGFRIEPHLISTQPFVWSDTAGIDVEYVVDFTTPIHSWDLAI